MHGYLPKYLLLSLTLACSPGFSQEAGQTEAGTSTSDTATSPSTTGNTSSNSTDSAGSNADSNGAGPTAGNPDNNSSGTAVSTPDGNGPAPAAGNPDNSGSDPAASTPDGNNPDPDAGNPDSSGSDPAASTPDGNNPDPDAGNPDSNGSDTSGNGDNAGNGDSGDDTELPLNAAIRSPTSEEPKTEGTEEEATLAAECRQISMAARSDDYEQGDRPSLRDTSESELLPDRCKTSDSASARAAARSVDVVFINLTSTTLRLGGTSLWHGCWNKRPASIIKPHSSSHAASESCGFLTGTEGQAWYYDNAGAEFKAYWDNPFNGSNAYNTATRNPRYRTEREGGPGDNAQIKVYLMERTRPSVFNAIIASDPQAWRLTSGDPNSESNAGRWRSMNTLTVNDINKAVNNYHARFMIINGDITEFGRKATRDDFHRVYDKVATPFYFGLGNHDYANNVGDCTTPSNLSSNGCAVSALDDMKGEFDYYTYLLSGLNFNYDLSNNKGSMAYSWDYGENFHFIQLQNFPTYAVNLSTGGIGNSYSVTKSLDWLERDLKAAASRGKINIVNLHDYNEHFERESTDAEKKRFRTLLDTYHVPVIFAGHTHQQQVRNAQASGDELYGDTVVYDSGALFKVDFLRVSFGDDCIQVTAHNGTTGEVKTYPPICYTLPGQHAMPLILPALPLPQIPPLTGESGTFDNPKQWRDTSTPGTIYYGASSGNKPGYWESKFTGTAADKFWYFPASESSNEHWTWRGYHAGTYIDPKTWSEATWPGAIHKGSQGYWESRFSGKGSQHYYPGQKQDNDWWYWRGEHGGTAQDPKEWSEPTYPGAIHKGSQGYWISKFSGKGSSHYYPGQKQDNNYWRWGGKHTGNIYDPKNWGSEPAWPGTLFKGDTGIFEPRFTGASNAHTFPRAGQDNDWWYWRGRHLGTYTDPKGSRTDEPTWIGAIHKDSRGYWRSLFAGTSSGHTYPSGKEDNAYWSWIGEHAGTYTDPKGWSEPTWPGAIHKGALGYWESRFAGKGNKHFYPGQKQDNDWWYWRGEHAGTVHDPKTWGEYAYQGAIFLNPASVNNDTGYWEAKFSGNSAAHYYPTNGSGGNDYWTWRG